jgi:hypothetical protein
MKLTTKQRKLLYRWFLEEEGVSIEYGKLTLCDLRNYRHSSVYNDRRYQVHSDDPNSAFSGLYDDLDSAIAQFIGLKAKTKRLK